MSKISRLVIVEVVLRTQLILGMISISTRIFKSRLIHRFKNGIVTTTSKMYPFYQCCPSLSMQTGFCRGLTTMSEDPNQRLVRRKQKEEVGASLRRPVARLQSKREQRRISARMDDHQRSRIGRRNQGRKLELLETHIAVSAAGLRTLIKTVVESLC
jgi:hypothetical protein